MYRLKGKSSYHVSREWYDFFYILIKIDVCLRQRNVWATLQNWWGVIQAYSISMAVNCDEILHTHISIVFLNAILKRYWIFPSVLMSANSPLIRHSMIIHMWMLSHFICFHWIFTFSNGVVRNTFRSISAFEVQPLAVAKFPPTHIEYIEFCRPPWHRSLWFH